MVSERETTGLSARIPLTLTLLLSALIPRGRTWEDKDLHDKPRPLVASGFGNEKRRRLVLWFTISELSSRNEGPKTPEKTFEGGGDEGDSAYTSRVRNEFATHAMRPPTVMMPATAAGRCRRTMRDVDIVAMR